MDKFSAPSVHTLYNFLMSENFLFGMFWNKTIRTSSVFTFLRILLSNWTDYVQIQYGKPTPNSVESSGFWYSLAHLT